MFFEEDALGEKELGLVGRIYNSVQKDGWCS